MNTKKVKLYVDLMPGWQDNNYNPCFTEGQYLGALPEGYKRVEVEIELPCFGGTKEVSYKTQATSKEVKVGYQDESKA